ncbi:DNA repair protein Rad50p [Monosporozyma servazzii]
MSAIHKLSIQGIRSFDSNDRETIEFGAPLTLIVGMNGSGKTTIIECLKYATTGDLPPNSKGGVFIHDPKITGEKDIRAQVKLAFTSANGLNMIVTRNIQLLAKKTTNTFKTLEGQLVAINRSGERTTLSTKSLELDTQVPLYMGVPKAILDYVIFCHQEDSLWPLSEPSNLKKKFDEIFQAMKFTKAIDNLKSIKKDLVVDIKILNTRVESLKVDRDRSKSTKMQIHQLEAKISQYQDEVNSIEDQINKITKESDRLFKSNQDFQDVLSKVDNLRNLHTVTENEITRLSSSIELVDMSPSELRDMLNNFAKTLEVKEKEISRDEAALFSYKSSHSQLNNKRELLIRKEAELTSQKNNYLQLKEKLNQSIPNIASKYNININTKNNSIEVCLNGLVKGVRELTDDLMEQREKGKLAIQKLENDLKSKQYSETSQSQKLQYSYQDIRKLNKDIESLSLDLESTTTSEEELKEANETLNRYNQRLENWEKHNSSNTISSQIKEKDDQILLTENEVELIQDKISKTNQQMDLFAKLGLVKEGLKKKQVTLSNIREALENDEKMKQYNLKISNDIDIDFRKFFINLQKDIAVSNRELIEVQKKYTEAAFRLKSIEKDLMQNSDSIASITSKVKEELPEDCELEEYDELLAEAEMAYKIALENLKIHQTTLQYNQMALQVLDSQDCCYLCKRNFETEESRSKLLEELRSKTDSRYEDSLKQNVEEEKHAVDQLRSLEKDIIAVNTFKKKNAELNTARVEEEANVSHNKEHLLRVEEKNNNLKESREYAEKSLRRSIEQYTDISKEISHLNSECEDISDQLKVYSDETGNIQTVDELRDLQKSKSDLMRQLRKDINELQREKEQKSREYNSILSKINETNLHVKDLEKSIITAKNLRIDIDNKKKEVESITSRVEKLEIEVAELTKERQEIDRFLSEKKEQTQNEIDIATKKLDSMRHETETFKAGVNQMKQFEVGGFHELETCHDEITSVETELEENQKRIEKLSSTLVDQKEKLRDSNNERRTLKDNLELLNLKKKLSGIEAEIDQLDIQNAEAQRDQYREESTRLRALYEKLSADNAGKLGEMRQLQNQIESLSKQLSSDYKNIDDRYHKRWVELQAKTFATDDIDTYSKALDSAIMRYHSLKMEDINRIIDELWKRTYSGTDIDTIKIRSDEVNSTVRGKSYNYRVVMFKQDAELDMRGRCSAGQKVIASIIIRLALSETFGTNCGVIALDEPTTNLDEENIESLARSLNNIIQFRKHQKNFQLIVITHDEKFLTYMNAVQFTDHFFKVKRDDRQKSQIEWVNINRVNQY